MKKSLLIIPLFICSQALALPEILPYFPGCDYQQYEAVNAQGEVETNLGSGGYESSLQSVLYKLRGAAGEQGADALVITDLKVHTRELMDRGGERHSRQLYKYTALPVDYCEKEDTEKRQIADYDHRGQPVINFNIVAKRQRKTQLEVTFPVARSLLTDEKINSQNWADRPLPKQQMVSLEQGLYGVKLGQNRAAVIEQLGYPSAEFKLFSDTQSLLYGRRHWLHFQQGKLVMAEFTDGYLAFELLNQIPPLPGFDNFSWQIGDAGIGNESSLQQVRDALPAGTYQPQSSAFLVKQGDSRLSLLLDRAHSNQPDADNQRFVIGFRLYHHNARLTPVNLKQTVNYQLISDFMQRIEHQQDLRFVDLMPELGQPLGRIFHSHRGHLDIFDNHLVLEVNRPGATRLHLYQQVFSNKLAQDTAQGWTLTSTLRQGSSLNAIRQSLGQHLQVAHGGIFLSGERYDMQLYLDGENEHAQLYSARVTFY
jgi:hypothetical protein